MIIESIKAKQLYIINWIFKIILLAALLLIYYLAQPLQTSKVLYIPSGSVSAIITHLKDKKIPLTSLDKTFLRFVGRPQQGWIYMGQTEMTHGDFLYKLTHAKAAMTEVTLIPGETTYTFSKELSTKLNLDADKLYNAFKHKSPYKEGSLVPDTYKLPLGINENEVALYLLRSSFKRHKEWSEKIFGTYNRKKWLQHLIVASIIQKEAANKKEMPIVSSVIYNRLHKGMKLQMDGTLNYGRYSHARITASRLRTDRSPYNTYRYKGLPPFPVCNVELTAIKAAIFPAKTDYIYFMKSKNGTHKFSRYYSTHLSNIRSVTK